MVPHIRILCHNALQCKRKAANAMKYIKQPKRHIVLDDFEWRALVKGINEYRKQVIDEDGCVEVVNELLLKIINAPTKNIKIMEG